MNLLTSLVLDPHTLGAVQGEYHLPLVLVSWAIALAASYAGLDLIKLVSKARHAGHRWLWLIAGAGVMGLGIWSMHFTGMHAYRLDFVVHHDPALTLFSIVPAVAGSLAAVVVLVREVPSHRELLLAGITLGLGIGMMHYTGMAAMHMPASLYHELRLFLLSLFAAVGLGISSAYAYRLCRQEWGMRRAKTCAFISALFVSLAICSMHYLAIRAAWFVPHRGAISSIPAAESHWLIYLIGGCVMLVALLTAVATQAQRRLHLSEQHEHMTRRRLLEVLSAIHDGVALLDDQARIRLSNAALERMLGWDIDQAKGQLACKLVFASNGESFKPTLLRELSAKGEWSGMIEALHSNGRCFPAWLSVSRVSYADCDERDYVALLSDRSADHEAQQRIRYLAYHDTLTELPNRRALQERLNRCEKHQGGETALSLLVLFDVDRFKILNDSLGQDIGDELLRQLATRLRRWAADDIYVARLDGNEFDLLARLSAAQETAAQGEARALTERVLVSLTTEYQLHGHTYLCRLSIGMLVFDPGHGIRPAHLFKRAGLALVEAKRQRDGIPQLFRPELEQEREVRLTLERELRHAIDKGELSLYLQPQVDALQRIIGAEALVRWQHPVRGFISPSEFIPLAEESGLILPLGYWVLQEGCRLLGEWRQRPDCCDLKLSLNVSVRQFQQPDFIDQVLSAIYRHDVVPSRLTLELTESLLLKDPDGTIKKMGLLRRIGVSFALDDFGTGYSSLVYLKSLPLDSLKIDIAFVRGLSHDTQSTPIAAAIVALGRSLELAVIAEGVETEMQRDVLASLGCNLYQGFLYGRPIPIEAFRPTLDSQREEAPPIAR
ncbi:bifunctional diguanylate cyclase/phosphodiesterase [Billgrantia sp. LNSP4103-1]|uniref:bifunctional diguanylate cyclase/phosphodiesterase n=1 Tax=Billgrantia sp. LNSP4103-1 TaxID=3410266 RepID=UPI00403F6AB2